MRKAHYVSGNVSREVREVPYTPPKLDLSTATTPAYSTRFDLLEGVGISGLHTGVRCLRRGGRQRSDFVEVGGRGRWRRTRYFSIFASRAANSVSTFCESIPMVRGVG